MEYITNMYQIICPLYSGEYEIEWADSNKTIIKYRDSGFEEYKELSVEF